MIVESRATPRRKRRAHSHLPRVLPVRDVGSRSRRHGRTQKNRYSRQILFAGIGEAGQQKLLDSSAVLVGCGATGTAVANLLIRAGLGSLRIIDRDFVEPSNLQRQTLFEESDAAENLPKAVAAERRLRAINSGAKIEAVVADLTPQNARALLENFPVILDGTDNFETRLLINDAAIALNTPWIYAAAVASSAVTMTILPGETPCLACLVESNEPATEAAPRMEETCDTAGILNAAIHAISRHRIHRSHQTPNRSAPSVAPTPNLPRRLDQSKSLHPRSPQSQSAAPASKTNFRYLEGDAQPHITLCGRDSVQIHERARNLDLAALHQAVAKTATEVRGNNYLLRFRSKFLRPNSLPRRPRHNQRHPRPSSSPHPLRPLHRVAPASPPASDERK